jgi:hypothetical protein
MTLASRTPEGVPHECPICGKIAFLEPCCPGGDSVCPSCGQLYWEFRDRVSANIGVNPEAIILDSSFDNDLGMDSLEDVELIMELEEELVNPSPSWRWRVRATSASEP